MSLQAYSFLAVVAVAIGVAVYQYFSEPQYQNTYQHQPYENVYHEPPIPRNGNRRRFSKKKTGCSICLDNAVVEKMDFLMCGHGFHQTCLAKWLREAPSCPLCRSEIK